MSSNTIVPGLKINGKTCYKDNFTGDCSNNELAIEIKNKYKKKFKSPFNPVFPMLGTTTNSATYQPFRTKVKIIG